MGAKQLAISQKAEWSPLYFVRPAPAATCRIITALLHADGIQDSRGRGSLARSGGSWSGGLTMWA